MTHAIYRENIGILNNIRVVYTNKSSQKTQNYTKIIPNIYNICKYIKMNTNIIYIFIIYLLVLIFVHLVMHSHYI